jgi:hypothetical protein
MAGKGKFKNKAKTSNENSLFRCCQSRLNYDILWSQFKQKAFTISDGVKEIKAKLSNFIAQTSGGQRL